MVADLLCYAEVGGEIRIVAIFRESVDVPRADDKAGQIRVRGAVLRPVQHVPFQIHVLDRVDRRIGLPVVDVSSGRIVGILTAISLPLIFFSRSSGKVSGLVYTTGGTGFSFGAAMGLFASFLGQGARRKSIYS